MSDLLHSLSLSLLHFPFFFFFISIAAQSNDTNYPHSCRSYSCGHINISYPFWKIGSETATQFCGYPNFGINCSKDGDQRDIPTINLKNESYYIHNIHYDWNTIFLVDYDVSTAVFPADDCPRVHNISIETLPFVFLGQTVNLTFHFNCIGVPRFAHEVPCLSSPINKAYVSRVDSEPANFDWDDFSCDDDVVVTTVMDVFLPGSESRLWIEFIEALGRGFELRWEEMEDCENCENSGGRCGYNKNTTKFMCFCSGGTTTNKGDCKAMFPSFIIIFILFPILSLSQKNIQEFRDCSTRFYTCGQAISYISYPFWGKDRPYYCGLQGFELTCRDDNITTLQISNTTFRVGRIDQNNTTVSLAFDDLWEDEQRNACWLRQNEPINDTTFQYTLFSYVPDESLSLGLYFSCTEDVVRSVPFRNRFNCSGDEDGRVSFLENRSLPVGNGCERVIGVPVSRTAFDAFNGSATMPVDELLWMGFQMEYRRVDGGGICSRCQISGGTCWSTFNSSTPSCICSDGVSRLVCGSGRGRDWVLKLVFGIVGGLFGIFLMGAIWYILRRRRKNKKRYYGSSYMSRNISSYPSSTTDPEKNETYHGVQIFKYRELEKATNNFDSKKELGDGGFGTVYHGKLKDGREVAVKRLYENNYKRVEQFMNEVGILAHLRHRNLVSLYGCTTHHSRELLLVYDYIPNGTVADHLHGEKSKPGSLPWDTRIKIATETASALVYLHASDVVHRDVKTNNILLDNSFSVKVADFGLSRLFPTDVTHVSTAPQGTPGYVDPEYHECYQLTSKSDVYSFGVVLIELISSKPAVDITRHRHEINLSNMALNKIRNDALGELVDPSLGFESDYEVRKMINAVAELAFRCLQNERDCRPSMEQVLEGLISIQNVGYVKEKEEDHVLDDDGLSLKEYSQTMSPDSVAIAWSNSTISTSGG